jgi:hypothetical protein
LKIGEARHSISAVRELLENNYYRAKFSYVKFEDDITKMMPDTVTKFPEYIIKHSNEKLSHKKQRRCSYRKLMNSMAPEKIKIKTTDVDASKRALKPFGNVLHGPPCPLLAKYFPDFNNAPGAVSVKSDKIVEIEDEFFTVLCCNIGRVQENQTLPPTVYQNSEFLDLLWVCSN